MKVYIVFEYFYYSKTKKIRGIYRNKRQADIQLDKLDNKNNLIFYKEVDMDSLVDIYL